MGFLLGKSREAALRKATGHGVGGECVECVVKPRSIEEQETHGRVHRGSVETERDKADDSDTAMKHCCGRGCNNRLVCTLVYKRC